MMIYMGKQCYVVQYIICEASGHSGYHTGLVLFVAKQQYSIWAEGYT